MAAPQMKSDPVRSVLTITVGFLALYAWKRWDWALAVSGIVGISGVLSNYLAVKIEFVWMKIAWLLGQIVPNILLSIIYYLVLLPIALLSRLFGSKDPLMLKNKYSSTFRTNHKEFEKDSFEKPW